MPRIILDTNIIPSALVFGGKIKKVLDLVFEEEIKMLSCEELEKETLQILVAKFDISFEDLTIAKKLLEIAEKYPINKPYPQISRDKNDNFLLALIESSEAELLITGDKDLLVLKN